MSVIAEAVRHMLAAGMAHDDIVHAVSDMELAAIPARTARQDRNARYYAKKTSERRLNTSNSDVSDVSDVSDAPSPKQRKVSPNPSKETQPSPSTPSHPSDAPPPKLAADRGSRLPDDWRPSPEDLAFAAAELGEHMAAREVEKFRNYWLSKSGKDGRKVDWARTFRNWVMAAKDRFGGQSHGRVDNSDRRNGSAPRPDPVVAALARRVARNAGPIQPVQADDPFGFGADERAEASRRGPVIDIEATPPAGGRSGDRGGGGDGAQLFALPVIGRSGGGG